jgi:predicted phage terminase large subunit-like protein
MRRVVAACDTALTTKTSSDFSVFQIWGESLDGKAFLIDQVRGRWEAPALLMHAKAFWQRHRNTEYGPGVQLQAIHVESAAAGFGLIQQLRTEGIPVIGITASKDKFSRCLEFTVPLAAGLIYLPVEAPWVNDLIQECVEFTSDDSHSWDDQADTMWYAVDLLFGSSTGGQNRYAAWQDIKIW